MTLLPSALRLSYLRGELDKHEFARQIGEHHRALRDTAGLLEGSDIAAIELTPGTVTFVSRFGQARFPCDPVDRGLPPVVALNFGAYERKDFSMLLKLVPSGGTFVDIGANIGWYSIHVAIADREAHVIAVEPIPSSFLWMLAAIAANSLSNVTPLNTAVGSRSGTTTLFVDSTISGAASAAPSTGQAGLEPITCPVMTIDEIVYSNRRTVDVLKLDIEGGELLALKGAVRVLTEHRPIVFCEMLRKLARPFGYHPNDIIALMDGYGYACYRAEPDHLVRFESMDEETIETNFYFLHTESHAQQRDRFVSPSAG